MSDIDLVTEIDEHEVACSSKEAKVVDGWLKQLALGRRLSRKQRKWAEDILERLDDRSNR